MSAPKPAILAVDDEPAVLGAVARDLRREYGARYRILRADSGAAALEALKTLKLRAEPVALLVADQRMPGLSGVELLAEARALHPEAKRVLLTAYADTDAAIRAINEVKLDHYLMKPWDPPEERLYPVLDDLLDDWQAGYAPAFQGVSVIGHRFSAAAHAAKDFLARNLVPYRWLDAEADAEARALLAAAGADPARLPVLLLPDGAPLIQPTNAEIGLRIGLAARPARPFYDLLIVGAGPAGLAAAVYGASEGLRTLLVEQEAPGGQAGMSSRIENYLGFPVGLSGGDLARRAVSQAKRFGAEILTPLSATGFRSEPPFHVLNLSDGGELSAHALLIATGVSYRKLDAPGVERLAGSGVYYGAAITEAQDARDQEVFVIGAGNSAGQAALYLARFARRVSLLVRGGSLAASMSRYLVEQLEAEARIVLRFRSGLAEAHGDARLEALTLEDLDSQARETVPAHALFIFIGALPRTDWVPPEVARDPQGFILSGPESARRGTGGLAWGLKREPYWLETSVPGVFTAGDVRYRSVKRVASAVGEGAMAVQFVHQHLSAVGGRAG